MNIRIFIFFLLLAAVAAADVEKIESDAAAAEENGQLERSVGLYAEAARLRGAALASLEKAEAKRKKGAGIGLDEDLEYGEDDKDEIEDDLGVTQKMDARLQLQAASQISKLQVITGYDLLHAARTNDAERLFSQAEKTTAELRKLAGDAKDPKLVEEARLRLLEIRVYKRDYEPPKDVPPDRAAAVWTDETDVLGRRGDYAGALAAGEKAIVAGGGVAAVRAMLAARDNLSGRDETFAWLEKTADDARFGKKEQAEVWNMIGAYASTRLRPETVRRAADRVAALGGKAGAWAGIVADFEAFERFPLPESEIVFPKSLADFGVKKEGKTVRAENYLDLDGDGSDMTQAIQEALDTPGVQTVVIGKLDTPWRIRQIVPHSNQRIQLEKGVRIIGEKLSRTTEGLDTSMFLLRKVRNVVIEGLGEKPEDCFIGKYETHAERKANGRRYYGGSGVDVDAASDVLVRNLKISYNTCDGVCVSGLLSPSRRVWLDNLVLDGNYRQGMSIVNANGVYSRGVVFSGTDGNEPMAGVDLEPVYHSAHVANVYFIGCTFRDNTGGGLLVAAASYRPVTISAKRCLFEAQSRSGVLETARTTLYTGAERPALGLLSFEDCTLCRWRGQGAVRFEGRPLFDMKFVNSTVKITDDRPAGSVPDGPVLSTNTAWNPLWADWRKYPFDPKLDLSGLKAE